METDQLRFIGQRLHAASERPVGANIEDVGVHMEMRGKGFGIGLGADEYAAEIAPWKFGAPAESFRTERPNRPRFSRFFGLSGP